MGDMKALSDNNRAAIMDRLNSEPVAATHKNKPGTSEVQIKLKDTPQHEELISLFITKISASKANVFNIDSINDLPSAIKSWLGENNLPNTIYCGENSSLTNIDWASEKINLSAEAFTEDGQVAISTATCAIADTGSLVLLSGLENPTKNNFLAEHHLVILDKNTIVYRSEDAWAQLLNQSLPRAVNFISGPSSSGDVGLKIEYGAHGPRTLTVLLIG